jgi:hypothetical protein
MEPLHIAATRNTPMVVFLPDKATFRLVGNSIPENAGSFYAPVVTWLQQHLSDIPTPCSFVFSLPYFNSSSLKALYSVLVEIKNVIDQGKEFEVNWYVEDEDEFMIEAGETYQELLGMKINLITGDPAP